MTQPTQYSNTSTLMTLTVGVDAVAAQITVNDASGLPIAFPYNLAIDADTSAVEIVQVTATAGNVLTVNRGQQDTSAKPHSVGAQVFHAWTAGDGWQIQDHIFGSSGVHGLAVGTDVVGTDTVQTLTNKTMSGLDNTFTNLPGGAITPIFGNTDINQESTGVALDVLGFDGTASPAVQVLMADTQHGIIARRKTSAAGTGAAYRVESETGTAVFTVTKQGRMTANTTAITQDQAATPGLTVTAHASPTAAAVRVVGDESFAGLEVRRNSATTTGDMMWFVTETGTQMAAYTRAGTLELLQQVAGQAAIAVEPHASGTISPVRIVGAPTVSAIRILRNNSTTTGNLQEWSSETGSSMAWVNREGDIFGASLNSTGDMSVDGNLSVVGNIDWNGATTVQMFDSGNFATTLDTYQEITTGTLIFVAPPSGKVTLGLSSTLDSAGGVNVNAVLSYRIREGSTAGSGTIEQDFNDDRAIWSEGNLGGRFGITELVSGLTAGQSYNLRFGQKSTVVGTNSVSVRRTVVANPSI